MECAETSTFLCCTCLCHFYYGNYLGVSLCVCVWARARARSSWSVIKGFVFPIILSYDKYHWPLMIKKSSND